MTQSTVPLRELTDALLTALRANGPGIDVGDAEAPSNPNPSYPYAVLYPDVSPELTEEGGTLSDPSAHRIIEWTLTSVGRTREQAQGCSDLMRATLHAATITVSGRNLWRVDVGALGEIERDDDVKLGAVFGSLFYANDQISIPNSPG